MLQGNLGDPIYHPQFHEISEYFFDTNFLNVTTNGTQSPRFWERILKTWPTSSQVTFSIDGLKETNHLYRVGSKWLRYEAIFELIAKTKRQCKLEWKFIVFDHNKHQVEEAKNLARKIGFDTFRVQKSRPLEGIAELKGNLKEYWSEEYGAPMENEYIEKLDPFCLTGDMHYINAHGDYFPCCWWSGMYDEMSSPNSIWSPLNISQHSAIEAYRQYKLFSQHLSAFKESPEVCKMYCRKRAQKTKNHKTPNTQQQRVIYQLR